MRSVLSLLLLLTACSVKAQLQEGDIILQRIPCGNLCDAIVETTPCKPGMPFNHCGIVHYEDGKIYVIEAIGKRVQQNPLDSFAKREKLKGFNVARLRPQYREIIPQAIRIAKGYIGTPYDDAFLLGDKALYCSELVWETYRRQQQPIFSLQPMTFISPRTNTTYPAWEAYYKDLGIAIPEGQPGINPCAIANAEVVELLVIE